MLWMTALTAGLNVFMRAKFANWSAEDQLYQLKLHLDKTALNVFRMLPDNDRKSVESATEALKKRLKPADIEELRGLEFHHRSESIEQLGISLGAKPSLQSLAKTSIAYSKVGFTRLCWSDGRGSWVHLNLMRASMTCLPMQGW